jgi:hypothetical protein
MSRGSINGLDLHPATPIPSITTHPNISFSIPFNHFVVHRPRAAKPLRYAPGVSTLLGAEQIVVLVNSAPVPKGGLAASVEPGGAGQEKDSDLLRM